MKKKITFKKILRNLDAIITGATLTACVVIANLNVIMRYFFNHPLQWNDAVVQDIISVLELAVLIMLTVISIQYVHNLIYVRGVYKPYVSDILRFPRWWIGIAVPIGFALSVIYSIWFLLTDRLHIIKVKPSDDDDDYKVEEGNF